MHRCIDGANLRSEYLASVDGLIATLKRHGIFDPETKIASERSAKAYQRWHYHSAACKTCHRGRIPAKPVD